LIGNSAKGSQQPVKAPNRRNIQQVMGGQNSLGVKMGSQNAPNKKMAWQLGSTAQNFMNGKKLY